MSKRRDVKLPPLVDTLELDADALTVWRERMRAAVHRLKHSRGGAGFETSDLVQEGMSQVCRDIGTFRGSTPQEFDAWIKRISAGNLSNAYRYAFAKKRDVRREVSGTASEADSPKPEDDAEREEMLCQLATSIERLSAELQYVVVQHVFEERTYDDIAGDVGCSGRQIRALFDQALHQLRDSIANEH